MIGKQTDDVREKIIKTMQSLTEVLLEKNKRYGDSALNPAGIFNKGGARDSISARLDDKLGRIANAPAPTKNDTGDLMGYLCLYCVNEDWTDFSDQID